MTEHRRDCTFENPCQDCSEGSSYVPEGGLWTAAERLATNGEEGINGMEAIRAVSTVAALVRALEEILNGQIGGNVDTRAKRFENARALLAEVKK